MRDSIAAGAIKIEQLNEPHIEVGSPQKIESAQHSERATLKTKKIDRLLDTHASGMVK